MNKWKFLDLPRFSVLSLSQVWPWLFDRRGPEGMSGNWACAQSISVHCGSWHGHSASLVTSAATFSGPSVSHYHFISLTTENQTISELYSVLGLEQWGLLCCQSKLMGIFLGIPRYSTISSLCLFVFLWRKGLSSCTDIYISFSLNTHITKPQGAFIFQISNLSRTHVYWHSWA